MQHPGSPEATGFAPLNFGLRVAEMERRLTRGLALVLSEEKTTPDQWRVLASIAGMEAPTMSDLAADTCLPSATVTRTVDSLVDDALVFRLAGKQDRRRINVYLSEFGRDKLDRLNAMGAAWERSLRAELGDDLSLELSRSVAQSVDLLRDLASR